MTSPTDFLTSSPLFPLFLFPLNPPTFPNTLNTPTLLYSITRLIVSRGIYPAARSYPPARQKNKAGLA
jgi:hypothetical protein